MAFYDSGGLHISLNKPNGPYMEAAWCLGQKTANTEYCFV